MDQKHQETQIKMAINYFVKNNTLKIVGAVVLILGLISLGIGVGIIGLIFAIVGIPVGIVLFFIGSSSRASDDDMDADLERKLLDLRIEIDNERRYKIKLLPNQKDITIEGYNFDGDIMIKRLPSGGVRTNSFTRTKIRLLSDRIYIVTKTISHISNESTKTVHEIMLEDFVIAGIQRDQKEIHFNENTFFVKPCHLVITTQDNVLSFPIIDAITSDELATTLERHVAFYKAQ